MTAPNPFADIMNRAAPAPAPAPAPDPGPGPIGERILALEPGAKWTEGSNLVGILTAFQEEQTRMITELITLGCPLKSEDLRTCSLPDLRKARLQYMTVRPVDTLTREQLIAESKAISPTITDEMCAPYDDAQIRAGLLQLRAEAAVDAGQVDPPDRAPETAPVDVAAQAQATEPEVKAKSSSKRGLKMPEEYGGQYLSQVRKSEGKIQAFLQSKGCEVPKKLSDMKKIAERILTGEHAPGTADVPSAGTGAYCHESAPVPPSTDRLAVIQRLNAMLEHPSSDVTNPSPDRVKAIQRLNALCLELGITWDQASADRLSDAQLVEQIKKCELTKAQISPPGTVVYDAGPPVAVANADGARHLQQTTDMPPAPVKSAGAGQIVLLVDCRAPGDTIDAARHPALCGGTDLHWIGGDLGLLGSRVSEFVGRVQSGEIPLAGNVYVSTRTPVGAYLAEALSPLANGQIIRGDR
jgi:hypothetical protein